jgi:hypothetical protein
MHGIKCKLSLQIQWVIKIYWLYLISSGAGGLAYVGVGAGKFALWNWRMKVTDNRMSKRAEFYKYSFFPDEGRPIMSHYHWLIQISHQVCFSVHLWLVLGFDHMWSAGCSSFKVAGVMLRFSTPCLLVSGPTVHSIESPFPKLPKRPYLLASSLSNSLTNSKT